MSGKCLDIALPDGKRESIGAVLYGGLKVCISRRLGIQDIALDFLQQITIADVVGNSAMLIDINQLLCFEFVDDGNRSRFTFVVCFILKQIAQDIFAQVLLQIM